jgi:multidrug efflux system outer membrane protein
VVTDRILVVAALIALAGCTVGPEPRRPDVDAPEQWAATDRPDRRAAWSDDLPSRVVATNTDARRWWAIFGDPVLDGLVDDALKQNLDVQQAGLRIAEAREQRDATASAYYPNVEASGIAGRSRMSENGIGKALAGGGSSSGGAAGASQQQSAPSVFNLFQAGFDATWEPDLWGKTTRGVQAANADIRAADDARHDAMVSMTAEIARAYLTLRGAERQREITRQDIATQEHLAELVGSRNAAGLAPSSDVASQQVQVSASRAQLPQLEQQIAINRNRLALLLAMPPGALDDRLAERPLPALPPQVPIGLPGDLLRRRPDVRQREAQVESATARIGVARAQLFPSVRFGATGGLQSTDSSSLFDWASRFGIFGAQVSLPIFEGGKLHAQVRIADLRAQEAVLSYRQTVLTAFHDVDNALTTYAQDQHRAMDLDRQLHQAERSRDLATDRYRSGLGAFIDVLNAEHQSHLAAVDLAQSTATASTDLVALFKALGGGWDDADADSR